MLALPEQSRASALLSLYLTYLRPSPIFFVLISFCSLSAFFTLSWLRCSYGLILPSFIWKQIQLWEAEEFHRTKVSQLLALCHKNVGFRDVITRGFRVLDHMFLVLDLPCKTIWFWQLVE